MAEINARASAPVLKLSDNHGINIKRTSASALPVGAIVHLTSGGTVDRCTPTQTPLGTVVVSTGVSGDEVTVCTHAHAVIDATASGNIATGALVSQTSATGDRPTVAATANGQFVHGIVLQGGNNGTVIRVAIIPPFRNTAAA